MARAFEETGATGPWLSGYDPRTRVVVEGREYLRFDIGEVEGNIWAEDLSRTLEAKTGRFDPEATGGWLAACGECREPEILEHGGIEFYSWREFDPVSRGGRIALDTRRQALERSVSEE